MSLSLPMHLHRCNPLPCSLAPYPALCLAWCLALPAHAGRPLSVDDAGLDEAGTGHVEVWWEGARAQPGTVYAAPAYVPVEGLELGAVLARDRAERQTLQGLQAKWQWSASQEQGCNAASSAAVLHRQGGGEDRTLALALLGTCTAPWGSVHANMGAQREPNLPWQPTWGLALEKSWGALTAHSEAFGVRHTAPTFQMGARWDWAGNYQLDGTVGRQSGHTLLSVGLKHGF